MLRRLLVGAAAGAALAAAGLHDTSRPLPAAAAAAAAEPAHRAALIVDTGQEVRRICVRFAEDFISGAELLVRAKDVDPVFREYSGKGKAVCALCGVGCPADDSCLTCGGNNYWSYSRAPKGTSGFQLSGAGASSTRVRDGDVEGWRWSNGLVPAYATVDQVCGPAPGATSTTAAASPTTTAAASGAPPRPPAGPTTTARPRPTQDEASGVGGTPTSTGHGGETTTSLFVGAPTTSAAHDAHDAHEDDDNDDAAPPTVPTSHVGSGGSAAPLAAAGALVAGLLGWAAWLHRRRVT